ncbi:MAG: D-2-hydroxyacid dehydrogenase [Parvibaculum sp.]
MEILLSTNAAKMLEPQLATINGLRLVQFHEDGTLSRDGQSVTKEEISPQATWLSLDVLLSKQVFDFVGLLIELPSLKWLQSSAAGFDHPLFAELAKKGIRLTNSDAQAIAIAEYIMGAVLAEFQKVEERRAHQQNSKWQSVYFREIAGTSWMIVGIGNIGNETAKRAKAFGAHIIGVKRSGESPEAHETIRPADMKARLGEADIVVFTSPLNPETHHMGNKDFFAAMKKDAIFVNVGRGGLVDENALLTALDKGTPALALLDVFETEPLPKTSPLWTHKNVRVTPHASPKSDGTPKRVAALFIENLRQFMAEKPLKNEVNADAVLAGR